ncbi:MAG TPA: GNAT family N-acetyltransferase [Thermodesulfobacteriota bacterium]|nr:GNAT family N-acetyltransferase [Thermodesulfobacteriota bacterium]
MNKSFDRVKKKYPQKFVEEEQVFNRIRRGDRIFIGTGCGEPQHLVTGLMSYVKSHPKAFPDTEIIHVWTLGVAPYTDEKFQYNFRYNSFFVEDNTRNAVNRGSADYTPIFLSEVPGLFYDRAIPIDVALIQTSLPDEKGYLGLGVSVDIVRAAVENAHLVIAQVNANMPNVYGDGSIPLEDIDFIIPFDEPLLEYKTDPGNELTERIGKYVSQLIQDGDTIQVGYGSVPSAILSSFVGKKHLGIHTELLSDGMLELMKKGAVDNSRKSIDTRKTVAAFCMGRKETYDYLHRNPGIELRTADHTNNPLIIAKHPNMVAINSALEIDLTGQASAESIGKIFYSGIGGQADFMRGAALSPNGKTILAMPSTAQNGSVSRIVPFLKEGAGVTLNRGDVHYVVTEYGIAYLKGKNIRERAMELVAIADPKFRPGLIEEAKRSSLIYKDQAFIPGEAGEYPEYLEAYRSTKTGLEILLRPIKITDEPLVKDFFHSFSDANLYRRFFSARMDMPHEFLQKFVIIDYTKQMVILAVMEQERKEVVVGIGQYWIEETLHMADIAFAVRDEYQNRGVGMELFSYLTSLAKKRGLLGFTAEVLMDNRPMLHLCRKMRFDMEQTGASGVYNLKMMFRKH